MWGFIVAAASWLFGKLFGGNEPSAEANAAASAAQANQRATTDEQALAEVKKVTVATDAVAALPADQLRTADQFELPPSEQ